MEQLAIPDSYFAPVSELAHQASELEESERHCIDWLLNTHGCSSAVVPYVKRLFSEFSRSEAWDRAHLLLNLCGVRGENGWSLADADYVGLYDHTIPDYHILWDRGWAITMQVPRELVPKVWRCSYGGRPKFYDQDLHVIFESIFSTDGKPLTREQRRKMLESEGRL